MNGHKQSMLKGVDQFARTPDLVVDVLFRMFSRGEPAFHDPCPRNPTVDGLESRWKTLNFVNPPFDNVGGWLAHAVDQASMGANSVFLVPFRAETQYFWDHVPVSTSCVIVWINRIVFKPYKHALPATMATRGRFGWASALEIASISAASSGPAQATGAYCAMP